MKKLIILPVLLVLITACSQPAQNGNDNTTTPTAENSGSNLPENKGNNANVNEADVDEILELDNFKITPNQINVDADSQIKLLVRAKSGGHTFNIDAYNVHTKTLNAGEQLVVTIDIPASDTGKSIEYYCNMANHKMLGMTGKININ